MRRILSIGAFAVLPAAVIVGMFVVAVESGPIALDFHQELYPQAKALLAGRNPYPGAIWPPAAAAVAMPFTIAPPAVADVLVGIVGLTCVALALWIVGVRDARVYGVTGLWPQVVADIRIAHLTPLLCLLAALAWRLRERAAGAGLATGLAAAIKLFLWPIGVWLLATRHVRAAAVAAMTVAASLLLLLPFTHLDEYAETLLRVGREFDGHSYTPYALATRLGLNDVVARVLGSGMGALLLVFTWRRRSFALAMAAALALSPVVWYDYFALAVVPLAIARPTLSLAWFLPLVTWGLPSSAIAASPWDTALVLAVFAVVFWIAVDGRASVTTTGAHTSASAPVGEVGLPR